MGRKQGKRMKTRPIKTPVDSISLASVTPKYDSVPSVEVPNSDVKPQATATLAVVSPQDAPLHQRVWDIVRYFRDEALLDGLITQTEYANLDAQHDGARRLETYDQIKGHYDAAMELLSHYVTFLNNRANRGYQMNDFERTFFAKASFLVRGGK